MDVKGCNVRVQKVDDIHSFRFVLDFIRLCCNFNRERIGVTEVLKKAEMSMSKSG